VHQALSVMIVKKGRFILPKNDLRIYSLCGDPEPKNFAYNLVVQRDYNKTVAFQILEHLKQHLSTHFLQNFNSLVDFKRCLSNKSTKTYKSFQEILKHIVSTHQLNTIDAIDFNASQSETDYCKSAVTQNVQTLIDKQNRMVELLKSHSRTIQSRSVETWYDIGYNSRSLGSSLVEPDPEMKLLLRKTRLAVRRKRI
jgi:hypothetical protein